MGTSTIMSMCVKILGDRSGAVLTTHSSTMIAVEEIRKDAVRFSFQLVYN
jgi:hypothetical protein